MAVILAAELFILDIQIQNRSDPGNSLTGAGCEGVDMTVRGRRSCWWRPVVPPDRYWRLALLLTALLVQSCAGSTVTLTSISPNSVGTNPGTTTFTISGSNFGTTAGSAKIAGSLATPTSWTNTEVVAVVAPVITGGPVDVAVTTSASSTQTSTSLLSHKAPTVTSVTPAAAHYDAASTVTISGLNFGTQASANYGITVGSLSTTPTSGQFTHTEVIVSLSAHGSTSGADVKVSQSSLEGELSNAFVWVDLTLSSVTPSSGVFEGDTVTVDGAYFGEADLLAARNVAIGGSHCGATYKYTTTRLICQGVPLCNSAGTKSVVVSVDTVTSSTDLTLSMAYCSGTSDTWTSVGDTLLALLGAIITAIVAQSVIVGCLAGFVGGGMSGASGAAAGASSGLSGAGNGLSAAGQTALGGLSSLVFQMQGVALLSWLNVRLPTALSSISDVMSWLTLAGDMGIRTPSILNAGGGGGGRKLMNVVTIDTHGSDVVLLTALAWTAVLMTAVACLRGCISCFYTVYIRWTARLKVPLDPLFWFPKLETLALLLCYQGIAVAVGAVLYDGSPMFRTVAMLLLVFFLVGWPVGMALFLSHHIHSRKKVKFHPHRVACCTRLRRAWHAFWTKHIFRRNGLGEPAFPYNILAWKGEVEYWLFHMGEWEFFDERFENRFDMLFTDYHRHSYLFLPADMLMMTTKCIILGCVTGGGAGTHYGQLAALLVVDGARLAWIATMVAYTDGVAEAVDMYSNIGAILASLCALGLPLQDTSDSVSTLEEWLGAFMTAVTLSTLTNKIAVQLLRALTPLVTVLVALASRPKAWWAITRAAARSMMYTVISLYQAMICECICRWEQRRARRLARRMEMRGLVWEIVERALADLVDPYDPLYKLVGVDSAHLFKKDRMSTPRPRSDSEYTLSETPSDQASEVSREQVGKLRRVLVYEGRADGPIEYDSTKRGSGEMPAVVVGMEALSADKGAADDNRSFAEYFDEDLVPPMRVAGVTEPSTITYSEDEGRALRPSKSQSVSMRSLDSLEETDPVQSPQLAEAAPMPPSDALASPPRPGGPPTMETGGGCRHEISINADDATLDPPTTMAPPAPPLNARAPPSSPPQPRVMKTRVLSKPLVEPQPDDAPAKTRRRSKLAGGNTRADMLYRDALRRQDRYDGVSGSGTERAEYPSSKPRGLSVSSEAAGKSGGVPHHGSGSGQTEPRKPPRRPVFDPTSYVQSRKSKQEGQPVSDAERVKAEIRALNTTAAVRHDRGWRR